MYCIIAKKISGEQRLINETEDLMHANLLKRRFAKSMHLLNYMECFIVERNNVLNYGELGWKTNVRIRIDSRERKVIHFTCPQNGGHVK